MQKRFTNWLKTRSQFAKVVSLAIGINMILMAILVVANFCIKDITVTVNDKTAKIKTTKNTMAELLREWNVSLDDKDVITPDVKQKLEDGTEVEIKLFEVEKETKEEEVDYKSKTEYTSDLIQGEKKVTTKGVKGIDSVTYEVSYLGGKEQSRKEVDRKTVKKPVTEVIAEGTAVSYNGVKYSRKLTVVATAYTHTGNRTATGTYPKRGTMAVDRSVIAMGSYGYVPGYGEVHAEDTGGAIKGNRIDLFFESRGQAVSWGRRAVTLYVK
ncbi:MAG: 3D domain-containing protein [Bacillota bacterium]|nr:3D domain-containing protein [Bacillota bacterium]